MNFSEKITSLRKKNNMTQEQLADYLGVSRQAVYKWENNLGYPETETLIKMSKLYECCIDYLLNDSCEDINLESKDTTKNETKPRKVHEYVSKKKIFGMPLVHVAKNAKGFIAIGLNAKGVFSVGLISRGIFSVGCLSIGVFSLGTFALGLIAIGMLAIGLAALGTFAFGLISIGVIAFGLFSLGSVSIGQFAIGAAALGNYAAMGASANAHIAISSDTGKAVGDVFSKCGTLTVSDKELINAYLDQNVPAILNLFKNIFKAFIS